MIWVTVGIAVIDHARLVVNKLNKAIVRLRVIGRLVLFSLSITNRAALTTNDSSYDPTIQFSLPRLPPFEASLRGGGNRTDVRLGGGEVPGEDATEGSAS